MTQPPVAPGYPPPPPYQAGPAYYPPPAPRRRSVLPALLLAAVAVLSIVVAAAVLSGLAQADKPPAAPTYATPAASDFAVSAQVVRQKCFGVAGCNVTFRPAVEYTGGALDPAATWVVVFEARPVVGGAFTGQFDVSGGKVNFREEVVRVPDADTKLMIKVTAVLPG